VPPGRDPAQALLEEIGELYAIILRVSRRIPETEPLTATQRLALIEIASVGPLRLRNLASRMDTTPATASRAVDVLEEYGLVVRRPDRADGRAVQIRPTARGRRWAKQRREELLEVMQCLPADLTSPRFIREIAGLNAALRERTGHDDVARGALLAP
jgi:DNA-binding MarR family transcriptional regulator